MALSVTRRLVEMLLISYMAFDATRGAPCETDTFIDCLRRLADNIAWAFDIVRLEGDQFQQLCRSFKQDSDSCLSPLLRNTSCPIPAALTGLLPAIEFLCSNANNSNLGFNEHRQCYSLLPRLECIGMQPQVLPMGSKYIANSVYKQLDLTYSESTEYRIHHAICVYLSVSRNIFCSEFFLSQRCGLAAAEWHTRFKQILLNMTFDSLRYVTFRDRRGSETTISLTDCTRLKEVGAVKLCEMSNRCLPVLNNFVTNVKYGIFTFSETDLETFCLFPQEEMLNCVTQILPYCSLVDILIYNGSLKVHEKLCSTNYRKQYMQHRSCLTAVIAESQFNSVLKCSDNLTTSYGYVSRLPTTDESVQTFLCNAVGQFLNCIEDTMARLCGKKAAAWQRVMTRFLLSQAFQLTFCASLLGHEDIDTSQESQSEALKANELETALFVGTSTVITCFHYVKRRYYV